VAKAKTTLSASDKAQFELKIGRNMISQSLSRGDFECWIGDDLDDIDGCVSEALVAAKLDEGQIDRVFLTGGSSFVPAVKARFDRRFGANKVETGDQFVSIAHGLSLIAQEADTTPWLA
jgi:hypothetical chaperone protein